MSEQRKSVNSDHDRRLKLAVELMGGSVSLAALGTVAAFYTRHKKFEDTVDLYSDPLIIAEAAHDERLSRYAGVLRNLTAASLAYPHNTTLKLLKSRAEVSNKSSNVPVRKLVEANILDWTNVRRIGPIVAPNKGFVSAVIAHADEVPQLLERVRQHNPLFELSHLIDYSSDPEMAAASLGVPYNPLPNEYIQE